MAGEDFAEVAVVVAFVADVYFFTTYFTHFLFDSSLCVKYFPLQINRLLSLFSFSLILNLSFLQNSLIVLISGNAAFFFLIFFRAL